MSNIAAINPSPFTNWNSQSRTVCPEASFVTKRLEKAENELLNNYSVGYYNSKVLSGLMEIYNECSVKNWDGYEADPVSIRSLENAEDFAKTLPTKFPVPEITADPDGEVSFEWYIEPQQVFSVSIGDNNQLSYAGLFGKNKTHGVEYFRDELPKTILENLCRLYA